MSRSDMPVAGVERGGGGRPMSRVELGRWRGSTARVARCSGRSPPSPPPSPPGKAARKVPPNCSAPRYATSPRMQMRSRSCRGAEHSRHLQLPTVAMTAGPKARVVSRSQGAERRSGGSQEGTVRSRAHGPARFKAGCMLLRAPVAVACTMFSSPENSGWILADRSFLCDTCCAAEGALGTV